MYRAMLTWVLGYMRMEKVQINPRICTFRSGPLLSANKIIECYKMYEWRAKARMMRVCIGSIIWACIFCVCSKTLFCLKRPKWNLPWHVPPTSTFGHRHWQVVPQQTSGLVQEGEHTVKEKNTINLIKKYSCVSNILEKTCFIFFLFLFQYINVDVSITAVSKVYVRFF